MKRMVLRLLMIPLVFVTGCVLLPVPHEQWLSPRFSGKVVDAQTGRPLAGVKVTLRGDRCAEDEVGPVVGYTDATGGFAVLASRRTLWLPVWLGPAEGPQGGVLRFERNGYRSVVERRSAFTSASSRTRFELIVSMKR